MLNDSRLNEPSWSPQAPAHRHVHRRRPRRRLPRRARCPRRHHPRRASRHAFTEANAGTDVVVRNATGSGSRRGPQPRRPDRRIAGRRRAPPSTVSPRPCPRSRASPRSSAPTATRSAATVRPPSPPTGSTIPSSTRYDARRGPRPAGRRRSGHRPRLGRGRASSHVGDTTTVAHARAGRRDRRRHRHVRRRRQPRRRHATSAFTLDDAPSSCCSARRTDLVASSCAPSDGVDARRSSRPHRRRAARRDSRR